MNPPANFPGQPESHREAVVWMSRIDRGLTPEEQDAFFAWLAASPSHGETLAQCRRRWRRLDRLADWRPEFSSAPNPDLLAPQPRAAWARRLLPPILIAAAGVAVAFVLWRPAGSEPATLAAVATPRPEDRRMLPDQSVVKVNDGAVLTVAYTSTERRVRLEHGEAFFKVAKDAGRPFVVEAGGATVQALGTAFNVRLGTDELDVLVAEGRVEVARPRETPGARAVALAPDPTILGASQRVSLSLQTPDGIKHIATLTRREIQQTLAWQHGLMTFQDQPLAAIVEELNRLNQRQLVLVDELIGNLRFSGTIRSDNLDGFVRILQASFGAEVAQMNEGEIHLRTRGG